MLSLPRFLSILFFIKGHFSFMLSYHTRYLIDPSTYLVTSKASQLASSSSSSSASSSDALSLPTEIEPQEIVKLFGRLAEKYIMLDPSGGMCK